MLKKLEEGVLSVCSSKIILSFTIIFGMFMFFVDEFTDTNHLIAYAMILVVAIWNRMDSRNKQYKASIKAGPVEIGIDTNEDEEHEHVHGCSCSASEENIEVEDAVEEKK